MHVRHFDCGSVICLGIYLIRIKWCDREQIIYSKHTQNQNVRYNLKRSGIKFNGPLSQW